MSSTRGGTRRQHHDSRSIVIACRALSMTGRQQSGLTLIELAIVLVIVGLVIGAVFKAQELITAGRVRSIIQQHDSIKAAYFTFMDRFRAPPGDYAYATAYIPNISTSACGVPGNPGNGNGDGKIDATDGEYILVWEHLSKAGFMTSSYTCSGNNTVDKNSVPTNLYGQYVRLAYDNNYAGPARLQHNFKTGSAVPSDILAEVDRKLDDGNALQGSFRGTSYTTGAATDSTCWDAAGAWTFQPIAQNCSGASLF